MRAVYAKLIINLASPKKGITSFDHLQTFYDKDVNLPLHLFDVNQHKHVSLNGKHVPL